MKVILLKDIRGLGKIHEIKDVSDGYARNMLFPRKLAEVATEEKVRSIEAQKKAHEVELARIEEELAQKIRGLQGKKTTISARATEKGGLFKGITASDISRAIVLEHKVLIPEAHIALSGAIKTVGEHSVSLVSKKVKSETILEIRAA